MDEPFRAKKHVSTIRITSKNLIIETTLLVERLLSYSH